MTLWRFIIMAALALPGLSSAQQDFEACRHQLQGQARSAGISESVASGVVGRITRRPSVVEQDRNQPEFTTTFRDYLTRRIDAERIAYGRELMATHRALLTDIEARYGVPAQYLLALWALETNYGRYTGSVPTLDALATLACDRRRGAYFQDQLMAALHLVDDGELEPDQMTGSWAGAMGNFQFMPSVYREFAVDANGDGKRDLWGSLPDALASAANFLRDLGWQPGWRWGREVRVPEGFPYGLAGLAGERPLREWSRLGITRANGAPLPKARVEASLIVPAGHQGPAFLVYDNFRVLMGWNRSVYYALTVGRLATRIDGAGPLQQPPRRRSGLRRATLQRVQTLLNTLGFSAGEPDGILGPNTRLAISTYQQANGLIADGYPGAALLMGLGITGLERY